MANPIKLSIKTEALPLLMIAAGIILGFYFYNHFPPVVVSHWGFNGKPDRGMSRTAASLFIPALITAMYLVFLALPFLDPKRDRYQSFRNVYLIFRDLLMGFFLVVFSLTGLYNLGYNVNVGLIIPLLLGLLMIIMGNYMAKIKPNWFIGIRSPWTLSSENVWNKTHRLGGKLFMLFGIILIACAFLPKPLALILYIAGILLITLGSFVYSYVIYKKEKSASL